MLRIFANWTAQNRSGLYGYLLKFQIVNLQGSFNKEELPCGNYCEISVASLLAMNTLLFEFLLLAIQCEIKLFSQIKCASTLLSLSSLNPANSSTVQLRNNLKNADFWAQTNASIKRFLTFFVKVCIDEVPELKSYSTATRLSEFDKWS